MRKIILIFLLPLLTFSCIEVQYNKGDNIPQVIRDTTIIERVIIIDTIKSKVSTNKSNKITPTYTPKKEDNSYSYGGYKRKQAPNPKIY